MASIWKVSDRKWRAQYTAPDGSRPSRTFPRRADAQDWLEHMTGTVRSGRWVAPSDMTLGAWLEEFVEVYRANAATATKRSYQESRGRLEAYAPALLDMRLQDITQPDIQRALNDLRESLHSRTVEITRTLVNLSMNKAIELGLRANNPVTGTKIQKSNKTHGGKYIPAADLADLLAKLDGPCVPSARSTRDLLVLMAHTGLRTQEARALRVEDLRDDGIQIQTALDRHGNRKAPKTEASRRFVPVPAELMPMLTERSRISLKGVLFQDHRGQPLTHNRIRLAMRRLTDGQYSPHDLRHTFVTNAIRNGVNLRALADIVGDRVETLLGVYTHVTDADRRQAVELANRPVEDKVIRFKGAGAVETG